jgi:hypothetical protein
MYDTIVKSWSEIKIINASMFDGRFCHSAVINEDRVFIYGGMKNAETTLDNMAILCLDGGYDDLEESKHDLILEHNQNINALKANLIDNIENINELISNKDESYLIIANTINSVVNNNNNNISNNRTNVTYSEIGVDTSTLYEDHTFDYESLKKNYINTMISWSFLKKLSEFHQWPIGCIGNFIENSLAQDVQAKNIHIDIQAYDRLVYTSDNVGLTGLSNHTNLANKILVLSIKDDGAGISIKEFNQILFSFSINEKKEYNFFKYGISLKASAIRLANSVLIISKTETELSIGMISKNIQVKMSTDFILTPVVNFIIEKTDNIFPNINGSTNSYTTNHNSQRSVNNNKYIPRSNFAQQSLNLILNETKFMFKDTADFFDYIEGFETGTHILLYDLKQISSHKSELNNRKNYELLFDFDNKDIMYNCFDIQIGNSSYIDSSLSTYLKFFNLRNDSGINIHLMGMPLDIKNPLFTLYNIVKNEANVAKANSNLKIEDISTECVHIDSEIYKGVLFNKKFYANLVKDNCLDLNFNSQEIFNGILLYRNNRLISRFEQNKLGDISFFIKEYIKHDSLDKLFKVSGFIEVPTSYFDLLYSKTVKYFNF